MDCLYSGADTRKHVVFISPYTPIPLRSHRIPPVVLQHLYELFEPNPVGIFAFSRRTADKSFKMSLASYQYRNERSQLFFCFGSNAGKNGFRRSRIPCPVYDAGTTNTHAYLQNLPNQPPHSREGRRTFP